MKKKIIIVFTLLISVTIPLSNNYQAFAHGGEDHGDEKKQTSGSSITDEVEVLKETQFLFDIQTTPSAYTDYYNRLKLFGKIMPSVNGAAQIIAPQNGFIVSLNVGIGERVSKGQVIAVIEQNLDVSEQIQISTEKSDADAKYEAAKKEYERLKSIEDIVSKKDLQKAQIKYNTATTNKKMFDNLTVGNSKLITLKSPIDGLVDNFNLAIGQQVKQGDNIFNVFDIKKLKIEAQIYDKDLSKITKDVKFFVEYAQQNHKTKNARLVAFGDVVNPINQSSQVILEMDNSEGLFKPGQFVNVDVMAQSENKKLVVPTSAIAEINGKSVVFIHHDPEVFKVIYVQLGESSSETTVILKGLEENERVVTSGTYQIKSVFMNQ